MKTMKKITAAVSAGLVLSAGAVCAYAEKPAGFENENAALSAELIARYDSGAISADGGSMEIVVYNKANGYAYAVSGIKGAIAAINVGGIEKSDDVANLSGTEFDVKELVSKAENLGGFVYGDITSVAVSPDKTKLAACIQHEDYSKNGAVAVFSFGENGELVNPVLYSVGVQPDMVTFADNSTILTADEGEPRNGYADGTGDPKGSVSVVDIANGTVKTVGFEKFTADELIAHTIIIHASAFETALMLDICPEMVHEEKIDGLKPTMLKGDDRRKWNEGNIENIALVPRAYVGDPAGYKYIRADMDKVYKSFAESLYRYFYGE